jgi:hypothetical protein
VTCVLDFAYADRGKDGLRLTGDDKMLERLYCFKDREDESRRVILKVHTLLKWGERENFHLYQRASKVTAAKFLYADWNADEKMFKMNQESALMLMPVSGHLQRTWQDTYREGLYKEAIIKGAAMYNNGDIEECVTLFTKTADLVLSGGSADSSEKERLKEGKKQASMSSSFKHIAWALRHAFDDILEGLGGGNVVLGGKDNAVVHQGIHKAISIEVPLYDAVDDNARMNAGSSCADLYTRIEWEWRKGGSMPSAEFNKVFSALPSVVSWTIHKHSHGPYSTGVSLYVAFSAPPRPPQMSASSTH